MYMGEAQLLYHTSPIVPPSPECRGDVEAEGSAVLHHTVAQLDAAHSTMLEHLLQ